MSRGVFQVIAPPDPEGLAAPLRQFLLQPGPQGGHALLVPDEGLRLDILGLFKAQRKTIYQ